MIIVGKTILKLHRVILSAPNRYNFQSAVLCRSIPILRENRGMLARRYELVRFLHYIHDNT